MSLVAYEASSSEESGNEDEHMTEPITTRAIAKNETQVPSINNGHISDDDDDFMMQTEEEPLKVTNAFSLTLPKPTKENTIQDLLQDIPRPPFQALPTPKPTASMEILTEEDDEFLHKKDKFAPMETRPPPPPKVPSTKATVKITIPSLDEFRDVKKDMTSKVKTENASAGKSINKSAGLLGMLPQAKSERNFSKTGKKLPDETGTKTNEQAHINTKHTPAFIPDTVKYRRPAHSTEENIGTTSSKKHKPLIAKPQLVACSDSEASDEEEAKDFFSFTSKDSLPVVSANEITAMVAKKAAKIAEVSNKYLEEAEKKAAQNDGNTQSNLHELELARKRYHEQHLDSDAVQALVGSSAKRRRNQKETLNIMELNSSEILPSRDEWMRTALASSTVYQPTGVLVDEEPAAGTRRKHQITYLAHKAKANEAELQAIWAANRQTRRATQSKYGF